MLRTIIIAMALGLPFLHATEYPKPYDKGCTERQNVFAFTSKPTVQKVAPDKYKITFSVKAYCDVAVGIIDKQGVVLRHLGSGVLGKNAPHPFQRDSLQQTLFWNGKDDLEAYVKQPQNVRVRVMLGLKPVFHKRLGSTSGKNITHNGRVRGIVIGPDGAYVFNVQDSFAHTTVRKFDREGNYLCSLSPPPQDLPEAKLAGMCVVDYASGKYALQGPDLETMRNNHWLPGLCSYVKTIQPALAGDRLVYTTRGSFKTTRSKLHYIHVDGSTDVPGVQGLELCPRRQHSHPRLVASPDGKKVYATLGSGCTQIFTHSLQPGTAARVFAGNQKAGRDNEHLGDARGLDCDAQGNVYVADRTNNRIQIFSPKGAFLKTLKIERPLWVLVHKKTGALYVQHEALVKGASRMRLSKFTSLSQPQKEFHWDSFPAIMALDSWSAKPRLWLARREVMLKSGRPVFAGGTVSVSIWEERGKSFQKISDFHEEAQKEDGDNWAGTWNGRGVKFASVIACDPLREELYYLNRVFDLKSGLYTYSATVPSYLDLAFDRRGYLHGHQMPNPRIGTRPGCSFRLDPKQTRLLESSSGRPKKVYSECPYHYGRPVSQWKGAIITKAQCGANGQQHGFGVNMRGDVAAVAMIYYLPKMQEKTYNLAFASALARTQDQRGYIGDWQKPGAYFKRIKEMEKAGVERFFIPRRAGLPLYGGTIWTFDWNGELRKECAVIAGDLINGCQINQKRNLFFVTARPKLYEGKRFLYGNGRTLGAPEDGKSRNQFTGTLVKTKADAPCWMLSRNAPVPLKEVPTRPAEMAKTEGGKVDYWIEGAEWLYAGASPIVQSGCICCTMRVHLDWYERIYVPEGYRQSFAILDSNGNMVLRVGRFANFDSAPGGKFGCKPGSTDIGITSARFISTTDNYLAFEDSGDRLVVLKLNYHAEEAVAIPTP